jgi:hypothetical protein
MSLLNNNLTIKELQAWQQVEWEAEDCRHAEEDRLFEEEVQHMVEEEELQKQKEEEEQKQKKEERKQKLEEVEK